MKRDKAGVFPQYVVITQKHRDLLKELRYRCDMTFSDTLRLGIELVAEKFAPKPKRK